MKQKITIDVVSDVVCPWCYIGKRRLENALKALESEFSFEIEYHPFELNPAVPPQGFDQQTYLSEKFGGEERYQSITAHTTQVAQTEGLEFNFDKQEKLPNTRKAHAMIQLAYAEGVQRELVEWFFKAYFTDGVDLTIDENLLAVAHEAGLSGKTAAQALNDESLMQVALAEQEIYKLGITGVPFYIINKKYGVSGAQASSTFEKAIREIANESAEVKSGQKAVGSNVARRR